MRKKLFQKKRTCGEGGGFGNPDKGGLKIRDFAGRPK